MTRWLSLHPPLSAPRSSRLAHRAGLLTLATLAALLGLGQTTSAQAQSQSGIYVCEDGNGPPRYQNSAEKGCKQLKLPPLNAVPAPKLPAAATRSSSTTASAAAAGRSNFPRVEAADQRERDGDRQRLISDELKREQERLSQLRSEFNNGEPERRGDERNYQKYLDRVESLRQEIGRAETSVSSLERELGTGRN